MAISNTRRTSYSGPNPNAPPLPNVAVPEDERIRQDLLTPTAGILGPAPVFPAPPVVTPESQPFDTAPTPVPAMDVSAPPPVPAYMPRDFTPELARAREQADERRFAAGLSRAGTTINAALTGRKADYGFADGLDKGASLPEERVREDMTLEQAGLLARQKRDAQDPNSAANRAFREQLRFTFPAFAQAMGKAYDTMTREQAEKVFGYWTSGKKASELEEQNAFLNKLKAAQLNAGMDKDAAQAERQRLLDEETARHNRMMEAIGWTNANRISTSQSDGGGVGEDGLTAAQREVKKRWLQGRVDAFTKDVARKYSPLIQGFSELNTQYPGILQGKVPADFSLDIRDKAMLAIPGGFGTWLVTQKGQKFKRAVDMAKDLIVRARTGAVVNEGELLRYDKMFDTALASNPESLADALRQFNNSVNSAYNEQLSALVNPIDPSFNVTEFLTGPSVNGTGQEPAPNAQITRPPIIPGSIPKLASPEPNPARTPAAQPTTSPATSPLYNVTRKSDGKTKLMTKEQAQKFMGSPEFNVIEAK